VVIRSIQAARRRLVAVALTAGLTTLLLATAGPVAATARAPRPPVGLSITLTDGAGQLKPNTDVRYTATLTNRGSAAVRLRLVLTMPRYARIRSTGGGKSIGPNVTWTVTARAGQATTRRADVHIAASVPAGQLRAGALVSAYLAGAGPHALPIVRAADSDSIAGVSDGPTAGAGPATPKRGRRSSGWPAAGIALGGLAVLAGIGAAGVALRRRRPSRTGPSDASAGTADRRPAGAASGAGPDRE